MKKYVFAVSMLALVPAGVLALGLPSAPDVGAKVDTTKIDNAIASCKDLSDKFAATRGKVDKGQQSIETISKSHDIKIVIGDPEGTGQLKIKVTDAEKGQLQNDLRDVGTVPDDLKRITASIPRVSAQVADALVDVANQIKANPLKSADLNKKKTQLDSGKETLSKMSTEAPGLLESSTKLTITLTSLR